MKRSVLFAAAAAVLVCWGLFVTRGLNFSPKYAAYDDSFNLYVMTALKAGGAAPLDQAAKEFSSYALDPRGREYSYFSVYRLLLGAVDLNAAMKGLSVVLLLLTAVLFYRSAALSLPAGSGGLCGGLLLLSLFLSMDTFYYGQNRAFGAALSAAWFYLALSGRGWTSPLFIGLFFPFYPYLSLSALAYSLTYPFMEPATFGRRWKAWLGLLAAGALMLLFFYYGPDSARDTAGAFSYKTRSLFGERISSGSPLSALLYFVLNLDEHSRLYPLLFLAYLGLGISLRFSGTGAAGFPRRLAWLAAAHAGAFLLLYPFNPFFASRQLIFIVPFSVSLWLGGLALARGGEWGLKALCVGAVGAFLFLNPAMSDVWDYSGYSGLCSKLREAKAPLAAGSGGSYVLAGLPLFCGVPVFYSDQLREAWVGRAPGLDFSGREAETTAALCSSDIREVKAFSARHNVSHLLVESRLLRETCPAVPGPALLKLVSDGRPADGIGWRGPVFLVEPGRLDGPRR